MFNTFLQYFFEFRLLKPHETCHDTLTSISHFTGRHGHFLILRLKLPK